MGCCSRVEWKKEVNLDLADNDETHVLEAKGVALKVQVKVVHLNLVFAQVPDEKALLREVPVDLSMLLANGVLVSKAEVVGIVVALLPPNVHFKRAAFFNVEFPSILGHDFCERLLAQFSVFQIEFGGISSVKRDL